MASKQIRFKKLAKFQNKQIEAFNMLFNKDCKYLLYGGAAHGGKSYFLRWAAVGLGLYYSRKYDRQDITLGLFSEDYPTLKDRQIIKIKQEFPAWLGRLRESRDEGLSFKAVPEYGGFNILLRNLDDPSKYASSEFVAILVEELTKNPVATFEDLRFRLRYPGIDEVKFAGATNPGSVGHSWVKKLWIEPDPQYPDVEQSKFKFIPSTAYDNKFTSEGYIEQLKALPDQKRKAFLEGSWDIFEGQVFSEWRNQTHVIDPFEIPIEWNRYIAIDWGVNKPFAVGWYAQDFDGHTYLYRELYMNGDQFEKQFGKPLTPKRLARVIAAINNKAQKKQPGSGKYRYVVCDPSMWNAAFAGKGSKALEGGESIAEVMSKHLNLVKGDNDRANGLQRYREALAMAPTGRPYYQVFKNCYNTIRTIPAQVYDRHKVEDVDTDGEDHCYDRDRYFFMSRPTAPQKLTKAKINPVKLHYLQIKNKQLEKDDYDQNESPYEYY